MRERKKAATGAAFDCKSFRDESMKALLAALAGCYISFGASAAPQTWNFTISDVFTNAPWAQHISLQGQFSGEDLDHDGKIKTDEVTSMYIIDNFTLGARGDKFQITPSVDLGGIGTGPDTFSALTKFEYWLPTNTGPFPTFGLLSELDAFGGKTFKDNFDIHLRQQYGEWSDSAKLFTMQFYYSSVDVVPVPEPASIGLMGLGLLGVGAIARRRKVAAAAA